jgi:glutaredoxin
MFFPKAIHIYGKSSCSFCRKAVELVQNENYTFTELTSSLHNDIKRKINNFGTVPIVFLDDKFIGGYSDLEDFMRRAQAYREFVEPTLRGC